MKLYKRSKKRKLNEEESWPRLKRKSMPAKADSEKRKKIKKRRIKARIFCFLKTLSALSRRKLVRKKTTTEIPRNLRLKISEKKPAITASTGKSSVIFFSKKIIRNKAIKRRFGTWPQRLK